MRAQIRENEVEEQVEIFNGKQSRAFESHDLLFLLPADISGCCLP